MYEKTEGIVLREIQYKDADKLLTVLTRDLGKITVRIRGIQSGRSRSKASGQLLAFSEFTLLEKQGRYCATETAVKEMFPELRTDLERLSLASYFAQVTETVCQENDPAAELLSLLLNSLFALSRLNRPQLSIKAAFELRLACLIGFLPDLRGCAVCGKTEPDRFNVSQGVLQCASCRAEGLDGIRLPLSSGVLAAMRYIAACDAKRLFSFSLSPEGLQELSQLTESYLTLRLERSFSTLDFYKSLFL